MQKHSEGFIVVIRGCMFSGKTEELIRFYSRAKIAKRRVIAFKPVIDNRYEKDFIFSHSGARSEEHTSELQSH